MVKKKTDKISEKKLTTVFNSFAKKAMSDFPHLQGKFLFYSIQTNSTYGHITDSDKLEDLFDEIEYYAANDNSTAPFALKVDGYDLLVYKSFSKTRVMTGLNESYKQEVEANLEHELGHLVAPAGYSDRHSENFCECVADSFAFIRLRSRYSKKNVQSSLDATSWISTQNFILYNEKLHFTAPVLTKLGDFLRDKDVSKLAPAEVSNTAYRAALKYALPDDKIDRLSKIFEPVRKANKTDSHLALKLCAQLMLKDHGDLSNDVFFISKTYLEPFLNKDKAILGTRCTKKAIAELKFEGAIWDKVSACIKSSNARELENKNADFLELLGAFDENKSDIINPVKYETKRSMGNIKRTKDARFNKGC